MKKGQRKRVTLWVIVICVGVILAAHIFRTALRGSEVKAALIAVVLIAVLIGLRAGFPKPGLTKLPRFYPWTTIPILLTAVWAASARMFGKFDVSATLYHMQHSVKYDGVGADVAEGMGFIIAALVLILCVLYLGRRDKRVRVADHILALPILLINPVTAYAYAAFDPAVRTASLYQAYVEPNLQAPKTDQKNLMIIYLESVEDTFDAPEFGDAFDALDRVAARGLRFEGVEEIQDTGWTVGGLVATNCGVPLLSLGLIMRNRFRNIDSFLPNAKCLASQLQKDGYHTVFYGAGALSFAGKGRFLSAHGYQDILSTERFPSEKRGEVGVWGLYDDVLFDLALERLGALEQADQPYLFSLLTLAAHSPKGYPSPSCYKLIDKAKDMEQLVLSVKCTGLLLERFLERARAKGYLKNTVVFVTSDHLAHTDTKRHKLAKLKRQDFSLLMAPDIPPGIKPVNGSMIDIYPTLLEALGYDLDGGKAGLGVSLLSDQISLKASMGLKTLNRVITNDKELRSYLWDQQVGDAKHESKPPR